MSALLSTALGAALPAAAASSVTDVLHQPWSPHDTRVLAVALVGVALLVLAIVWLKLHAFIALTLGSLFVGAGSGLPLDKVIGSSRPASAASSATWGC